MFSLKKKLSDRLYKVAKSKKKQFKKLEYIKQFGELLNMEFNNRPGNLLAHFNQLGIELDISAINSFQDIEHIKTENEYFFENCIAQCSNEFVLNTLLHYGIFDFMFDDTELSKKAYINFLYILEIAYNYSHINKSDYKLILNNILYNCLCSLCALDYKYDEPMFYEKFTDWPLRKWMEVLRSDRTGIFSMSKKHNVSKDIYLNIVSIVEEIIKKLAKIEFNVNTDNENTIDNISHVILNESIIPIFFEAMLYPYNNWKKHSTNVNAKKLYNEFVYELERIRERDKFEGKLLQKKFEKSFNVTNIVSNVVKDLIKKNEKNNTFTKHMKVKTSQVDNKGKIVTKSINSKYITQNIGSFLRNNEIFEITKDIKDK